MKHFKGKLKDEEVPGLIFFLTQLLKYNFKSDYDKLENKDIQMFLDEGDISENKSKKSITIEPVKSMFELTKFDTGYRPLYTSIEYLLEIELEKEMSFKAYLQENKEHIESHFDLLNYVILEVNTDKKDALSISSRNPIISLGSNTKGIQINLDEGVVASILESVAFKFGNLLSNEIIKDSKGANVLRDRIQDRINLTEERRQSNSESIIEKAIGLGKSFEPSDNIVDSDWITEFFNISQDCSNEMLQFLWAKILAGEVDESGSFSRRTLHAIKLLDEDEASYFNLLCNCLWQTYPRETRSQRILFKNSSSEGKFSDSTWGFDSDVLQHLEDLGLIHSTYMILERNEPVEISYFGKSHELATNENLTEIEVVRLSSVGEEIATIVFKQENEAYYNHTLEFMSHSKILRN